jgi:hypothetical protein
MNNIVKKTGGRESVGNVTQRDMPQRKPHKHMSVEEMKAKVEKPFKTKTPDILKDMAKKLGL